jgi:hypothetical protein
VFVRSVGIRGALCWYLGYSSCFVSIISSALNIVSVFVSFICWFYVGIFPSYLGVFLSNVSLWFLSLFRIFVLCLICGSSILSWCYCFYLLLYVLYIWCAMLCSFILLHVDGKKYTKKASSSVCLAVLFHSVTGCVSWKRDYVQWLTYRRVDFS